MARPKRDRQKTNFNLMIDPEDQEALREMALALGYLVPAGKSAGQGSVTALVRALAQRHQQKPENLAVLKAYLGCDT